MPRRNILFVDIPSYSVPLVSPYREVLERRLKAQAIITQRRIGFTPIRPGIPYTRGLLLIAAYLEQKGHHLRYLVYPDTNDAQRFADQCKNVDIIGFTAVTAVVQQVYALCKKARLLNPSVICVLGGAHATAMGSQCLDECPDLDVVIAGPGELIFTELAEQLEHYEDIEGVITRNGDSGATAKNDQKKHEQLVTVADMPGPAYHLLSRHISAYAHNIRTFLGCPYKCNFCIERLSWRGRKGRNELSRVVDEIRLVSQQCAPNTLIHFSDSIFTLNKERTLELCYLLQKAELRVVFSCDTRVDHIDEDIVRALAAARFVTIRLGIEALDDGILHTVNKEIITDQSLQTLEVIRRIAPHILIHAYMLTGLPGSTMETMNRAAQNIHALITREQVDVIGNKVLVPYPGTPYFSSPEQYQMEILHQKWNQFDRLSFPVYRLTTLTEYQIYFGFLLLESVQLRAYEERICDSLYIDQAQPESLDYVYRSYVQQSGPRLESGILIIENNTH